MSSLHAGLATLPAARDATDDASRVCDASAQVCRWCPGATGEALRGLGRFYKECPENA